MGMRCPSCQEYVDPSALDACPNCGHGFQSSAIAPAIRPAGRPKLQIGVELGLAIDRTGSSAQFATGIRTSVPMILKPVCAKARWCRVWLQSHGDEDCGEHPVLLTSGGAPEQAIADLQTIVF